MKFNKWSMTRIKAGKKILTSRKHDYAALGDEEVQYSVGPLPWGFIKKYLYRDEGVESPEELQSIINQIFRRIVEDDEKFYVHIIDPITISERENE